MKNQIERAEPSRGAPEGASKYWIVEWRFRSTQKDYDWQPISRSPFGSELAAKNYHQREGFEYRILEYAPKESAQEYRCDVCGDHLKHGAQDETVIHFVPCECWRGNGGHVVLLEALRRLSENFFPTECKHNAETWYCDLCRHEWEQELTARQVAGRGCDPAGGADMTMKKLYIWRGNRRVRTDDIGLTAVCAMSETTKHTVNGDEFNGWYCYGCDFFSRDVAEAAAHDGTRTKSEYCCPECASESGKIWPEDYK